MPSNDKVNVEKIMEAIRAEIALRRKSSSTIVLPLQPKIGLPQKPATSMLDTSDVWAAIGHAEDEVDVGAEVTDMLHFSNPYIRRVAVLAGKVIVYLARFITAKQRRFNSYVIYALRAIATNLDNLDKEHVAFQESIKSEMENMKTVIHTLETKLSKKDKI